MSVFEGETPVIERNFQLWDGQFRAPEYAYLGREVAEYQESCKSFDPLASLRMYRYDLYHFGRILPETYERVVAEEMSFIAEGMDRAARTEFGLRRQGDDLMYYKSGDWQSYRGMLHDGLKAAKRSVGEDPRRQFLLQAAETDLQVHYGRMVSLKPGQQYVYVSQYPQDIEDKYGAEFVRSCGFFPDRKMSFLYRAYCESNGNVVLESQTLDGNNAVAIAAVLDHAAEHKSADMDALVAAHDKAFGGDVYAGRPGAEMRENAWRSIQQHADLIQYFLSGLETIARRPEPISALEQAAKRHVYGTWAALKQRIDGSAMSSRHRVQINGVSATGLAMLEQEVRQAFNQFALEGRAMVGCGGIIDILKGEQDILSSEGKDVFGAIFGKGDEKDCDYVSKSCPMCGTRNVLTHDRKIVGHKRRISGSCGCSKEYVKESAPVPAASEFSLAA